MATLRDQLKKMYPVTCQYCKCEANLVTGEEIYPRRKDLHALKFYKCSPCKAYVGVHLNSGKPKGSLAKADLRFARMKAHKSFDVFWRDHGLKRSSCYYSLAKALHLTSKECHIAKFNIQQCAEVVSVCNSFWCLVLDKNESVTFENFNAFFEELQ